MEKSEQCVAIKFPWMKGLGARRIHTKSSLVLGNDCSSPAVIECGVPAFARAVFHAPIILDQVGK
jgi:hypothetical protein